MAVRTIYDLKPAFQGLLRPITDRLARSGVTANQVTLAAAALSLLEGVWLYFDPGNRAALMALPIVLFIRMALNAIDGMLAREHDQKTRLGGVLNEAGDVVSDTVLYLPMALHPAIHPGLVLAFVLMSILTEFTGVVVQAIGGERRYDGPMGKSDRAFLWGTVGFLGGAGVNYAVWVNLLLVLALFLLAWTVVNRTRRGI